jgi:hypothetical protein
MKKPLSIILKVLGALLVLAVVAFGAFRIGFAQGIVRSPEIAEQIQTWKDSDKTETQFEGQMMRGGRFDNFGPGMFGGHTPFMMQHGSFGFNPIGKLLGFLFFILLIGAVLRFTFFRGMHHHGYCYGHMPPPWAQQPNPCHPEPTQPEPAQKENK